MFTVAPPKAIVAIQSMVDLAIGVQWLALANSHSSLFPLATLRRIGAHLDPSRPMLLWAVLFLAVGSAQALGLLLTRDRLAGLGALLAAPLLAFYGLLNGLASAANPTGTFTVLITMSGLALWNASTAVMLLGRRDTGWR